MSYETISWYFRIFVFLAKLLFIVLKKKKRFWSNNIDQDYQAKPNLIRHAQYTQYTLVKALIKE